MSAGSSWVDDSHTKGHRLSRQKESNLTPSAVVLDNGSQEARRGRRRPFEEN